MAAAWAFDRVRRLGRRQGLQQFRGLVRRQQDEEGRPLVVVEPIDGARGLAGRKRGEEREDLRASPLRDERFELLPGLGAGLDGHREGTSSTHGVSS